MLNGTSSEGPESPPWRHDGVWSILSELCHAAVRTRDAMDVLMLISERAVEILPAHACGVLVRYPSGECRMVAASGVSPTLLDLFHLHATDGPLAEVLPSGQSVEIDVSASGRRWPEYAGRLASEGFDVVHVFPMLSGEETFGTLNLFGRDRLLPTERGIAQALADLATLHLLRGEVAENAVAIMRRVQSAVQSRATLGQAIGVVAEHLAVDSDSALRRLRAAARATGAPLTVVAESVVDRGQTLPFWLDRAAEDGQ